jgi:hypothetical protein
MTTHQNPSEVLETNDLPITANQIGQLESTDEVIHFFAQLGYNVDDATPVAHATLGLDGNDVKLEIQKILRVGADPDLGEIVIYLLEVKSVTLSLVQKIARRFRTRPDLALLVLTVDYETLDFVLLDRTQEKSTRIGQPLKQVIRPRHLTVARRRPTSVALRVLRRFTFTEGDSLLQWEKLRSAYSLAEWTEEYFNNRALFADHYLKTRFTDAAITPAWALDVRPLGREVYKLIVNARKEFTGQPEATIRSGFYAPLFKLLGFEARVNKPGSSDGTEPDYYLYAPGAPDQPLAAALTYVWNRNLDDIDPQRDAETGGEIPGALVVSTLEAGKAPWVIATNGKLWRLYAATADNKATNYYEVDLEEAFAAADKVTALKYWWLCFRAEAFTGLLDEVRRRSQEYATELGKRLKGRVFEEIFPHFAAGLIAQMRAERESRDWEIRRLEIGEADAERVGWRDGEIDLDEVFQATLTFLYRLIFVAYAESLELLPLTEAHGYGAVSLRRLKSEIAEKGGEIEETAPGELEKAYSATAATLSARLQQLFGAIDAGDPALNLPAYNGGLFAPETPAGRLLARYAIPDRFLALGLDRLCRDVDDKTHALVFVDFKSLGVRQLGSIYEGLLEFKLHIAGEKLAVIKEEGKELYIPFAKAKNKRVLATLHQGDVYLENDKRERKATGSYYTPDYIVKYIVAHTVGPVLARKFAELAPQLRDAQQRYRKAKEVAQAKQEDPEKFWNTTEMQQLADACLDVKVLDPAMGSGHFLVEAVDYISDRLIDWLNGWSENPVWALLERTRRDILEDMERQQVTIPAERLVRVALLKRAVLKRCIYGVDLNAMAVELAKVSLWLDAFTLGAPLSFLDHHLKQGNSLIGSRIADVQAALAGRQQSSLFASNKFAGVMLATDLMRHVSNLSDNTVEQVASSRSAFRSASDHLAPFKRVLDVYTSRWFGNAPTKKGFEPVLEFLQRSDVAQWLEDPATPLPAEDIIQVQQVAATALAAAADKRFFHWELEFPEVFFAPSTPGGQDVQLREDGGFDAVVGNPPWGADLAKDDRQYCFAHFATKSGEAETHLFMSDMALMRLNSHGYCGFITPNSWLTQLRGKEIRRRILENHGVVSIQHLRKEIFSEVPDIVPLIFVLSRTKPTEKVKIEIADPDPQIADDIINGRFWKCHDVDQIVWLGHETYDFNIFRSTAIHELCDHIVQNAATLNHNYVAIYGIRTGNNAAYLRDSDENGMNLPALVSASEIDFYEINWNGVYLSTEGLLSDEKRKEISQPKILVQYTRKLSMPIRIKATVDTEGKYAPLNRFSYIIAKGGQYSLSYLMAVISSSTLNFYHAHTFIDYDIKPTYLQLEPIYLVKFESTPARRAQLAEKARKLYQRCLREGHACVLDFSRHHLDLGESDVVHDLLAFLAEQMIDLNQRKQAEVKRFLAWLEGRLAIIPKDGAAGLDSLPGKTTLQNYLGDYQKGEPPRPWDEFFYRLHQNRRRFHAALDEVKGEIEREFEQSLALLLPIKQQLASTDTLIDKIVYQLYGLSDAEIEIIERPQYEQALADAKQQVLGDKELADDDARVDALAAKTLTAGQRLQERVNLAADEAALDAALAGVEWLTDEARTFLVGAEYDLRTRPVQLDFSATVVAYAKAVEQMLGKRLFERFRSESGATVGDCRSDLFQKFMAGGKPPTLSVISDILRSKKELALRAFAARIYVDADATIFGDEGVAGLLADKANIELRNRAAHDTVLSREDALAARAWALGILARL